MDLKDQTVGFEIARPVHGRYCKLFDSCKEFYEADAGAKGVGKAKSIEDLLYVENVATEPRTPSYVDPVEGGRNRLPDSSLNQ